MVKCEGCGADFNRRRTKGWTCNRWDGTYLCSSCSIAAVKADLETIRDFDKKVLEIAKKLRRKGLHPDKAREKARETADQWFENKYGTNLFFVEDWVRNRPLVRLRAVDGWAEDMIEKWKKKREL